MAIPTGSNLQIIRREVGYSYFDSWKEELADGYEEEFEALWVESGEAPRVCASLILRVIANDLFVGKITLGTTTVDADSLSELRTTLLAKSNALVSELGVSPTSQKPAIASKKSRWSR